MSGLIGFLSPEGEFTPCNDYEHISVASEILTKNGMTENTSADIHLANRLNDVYDELDITEEEDENER